MKKALFVLLAATISLCALAQKGNAGSAILGKWKLKSIGMENMFHYDVIKDSFELSPAMLENMGRTGMDSAAAVDMYKMQFAGLKGVTDEFTKEGKIISSNGNGQQFSDGVYELDAAAKEMSMTRRKQKLTFKIITLDANSLVIAQQMPGLPAEANEMIPKTLWEYTKVK